MTTNDKRPADLQGMLSDALYRAMRVDNQHIVEHNDSYCCVKGLQDLLDEGKRKAFIADMGRSSAPLMERYGRIIEEDARQAAAAQQCGALRILTPIETLHPARIYVPCRTEGTPLEKDINKHVYDVVSRSLGDASQVEAFGDYVRMTASPANIPALQEELKKTPPAIGLANVTLDTPTIQIGIIPPSRRRVELNLAPAYLRLKRFYLPVQARPFFPEKGAPVTILDEENEIKGRVLSRDGRYDTYIVGVEEWFDRHKPKPGDSVIFEELQPRKAYKAYIKK